MINNLIDNYLSDVAQVIHEGSYGHLLLVLCLAEHVVTRSPQVLVEVSELLLL
jgi:hypothetical protein